LVIGGRAFVATMSPRDRNWHSRGTGLSRTGPLSCRRVEAPGTPAGFRNVGAPTFAGFASRGRQRTL